MNKTGACYLKEWQNSKDHTASVNLCINAHIPQIDTNKQSVHTYTEHTTEVRVWALAFSWFPPEREQGAGKTPWWHWLTHFCGTLSLMWPAVKPEDTHICKYIHVCTHTQLRLRGLREITKCCSWLSLSLFYSTSSVFCFSHFVWRPTI